MLVSLHLQTLYADLLQRVPTQPEEAGSVYFQTSNGKRYVYLKSAVGAVRRDRFIGAAGGVDTAARVAAIAHAGERARERRRIVSLLVNSGLPRPGAALGNVLDAISAAGLFQRAVLVGAGAYLCYGPAMGWKLGAAALTTQEADIATASLAIAASDSEESLHDILKRADPTFRPVPQLQPADPPSAFMSANGFMVDLVTPQLRRTDRNPMPLPNLRAGAAPPQHLAWLIDNPMPAVALYRGGVRVSLPQPARFAVHKLILARKRGAHEAGKRANDLVQAASLITALKEIDAQALDDALEDAEGQGGRGWRDPIRRSLKELKLGHGVSIART